MYTQINKLIPLLVRAGPRKTPRSTPATATHGGRKNRQALLTENSRIFVEELLKKEDCWPEDDSCSPPPTSACCITSMPACVRTLFERNVDYIVRRTGSSSSTSTPAAPCRVVAGQTVCTRQSRQKEGSRSGTEPDPGLHHLPELLPYLRKAGGDIRDCQYRSRFEFQQNLWPQYRSASIPKTYGP